MFGDSDARRDDLGSGEPLEVAEDLDPMDSDTDAGDETTDEWDDSDDQSDDASDADVSGDDLEDLTDEDDEDDEDDPSDDARDADTATAEVPYAPLDATPDVPTPPLTGDQAVDEAMMRLAESQAGSFAERIESGEHAHRSLQSRLGGLGGA
ncbi:hypothetical protein LJR027_002520 [Terrabacter sp. LjRoot27]|uniref:hypothetical protein n=1 Tax=Terrabacter sp. LjRoot27 TaxID=3342306 RepID=UPI003ECF3709